MSYVLYVGPGVKMNKDCWKGKGTSENGERGRRQWEGQTEPRITVWAGPNEGLTKDSEHSDDILKGTQI